MPNREKLIGPKQKDRTTTLFSKTVLLRGRKYSKLQKTLLTTKRRVFQGSFYLAKGSI
jgi:hypothetical protein